MLTIDINGTPRSAVGKKATKADRNAESIPCVMYGGGVENLHFNVTAREIRDLIFTPEFNLANVNVENKSYKCIVKSYQLHPVHDTVTHIDFLNLKDGHSVKVEVPLRFEGTSPGVKNGGKFIQKLRGIKVKTKPENMVNEVFADISSMELGSIIRVRDIKIQDGLEILNPAALPIAEISVPRALKEGAKK